MRFKPELCLLLISVALGMACICRPSLAAPVLEEDLASKTAWTFLVDGDSQPPAVLPVPAGGWRLNGFPDARAGTYQRRIYIPQLPGLRNGESQTTVLDFEAVNWEATISVGPDATHLKTVATHLSAWTPFRVDISRFVTPGHTAILRVHVRDRNSFKDDQGRFTVPAGPEWNDRAARGILRGVSLKVYPAAYIEDVFVAPAAATRTLSYQVTLRNTSSEPRRVTLRGTLAWSSGSQVAHPPAANAYPHIADLKLKLAPNETRIVTPAPLKWTLDPSFDWRPNIPYVADYHANLHLLQVKLEQSGASTGAGVTRLTTETVRFGFCTPGQQGKQYTLNGIPIHLRGDSLPEGTLGTDAFARLPGFLAPSYDAKGKRINPGWPGAVRNYQRLNYNVIRMHQIPCTRYMMDVCDDLGMLVIPETAIRGGGIAPENTTLHPEAFTTHLKELVLRDRNHPCVFKWSLENELPHPTEAFVRALYDTCRQADGTRPCSIDCFDNPELPNWPNFAVIDHYSQAPGTPDAAGGRPREDRPFGQGEYVWPMGARAEGPLWFALMTRAMRLHDNADLRPYTLIDVWPGVIPGLTPVNFPDPHMPPDSLEQGGRSILDVLDPWTSPALLLLQRSFAPLAAYDLDYDFRNTHSNGSGDWPTEIPTIASGETVIRRLEVFNDDLAGDQVKVVVLPTLRPTENEPLAQAEIVRDLQVPPGGHASLSIPLTAPKVDRNTTLEVLVTVWKNGKKRYEEPLTFVAVPVNKQASTVAFEGVDTKTQGDWTETNGYGSEAFLIPIRGGRANYQLPEVFLRRAAVMVTGDNPDQDLLDESSDLLADWEPQVHRPGNDEKNSGKEVSVGPLGVSDPRVPWSGPNRANRQPIGFLGSKGRLMIRVDTTDGKPHRLSLYLLDYKRLGLPIDMDIYDTYGHRLDSRKVDHTEEGVYLRYRMTGTLYVVLTSLTPEQPTLSGVFVDPEP